jgi:CheY-like chemotaxis protein
VDRSAGSCPPIFGLTPGSLGPRERRTRECSSTGRDESCSWTTTLTLLVVLSEQLRDDGFEVSTARDAQEALNRLEAGWPDLILLDLMMPRVDGPALAHQIKTQADLPIIVLSAIDTADSKARLLDDVAERACAPQPVGKSDARGYLAKGQFPLGTS